MPLDALTAVSSPRGIRARQVCVDAGRERCRSSLAEAIANYLQNLPSSAQPDSIRLHIPRALRMVYDIRNKRDAAHLANGIDPNLQDSTLVISVLDWVLAELIRLHHTVSPRRCPAHR